MLTACSKFWGLEDDDNDDNDTAVVISHDLSVSVSGLVGSVTLNWADQQEVLDSNGSFAIADAISDEQDIVLSLSDAPSAQDCQITTTTSFTSVSADITDVGIVCTDDVVGEMIQLRINVANYFNGDLIPNAEVDISWEDDGVALQQTVTTDDSGIAELMLSAFAGRLSVSADSEGFGENSTIISSTADSEALSASVQLLPVNRSASFSAADGSNLAVDSVQVVDIPPAAFVTADGAAYTGSVTAEITLIDPSSDPNVMPGDYTTVDTDTGVVSPIESFGAVNYTFESDSGETLSLADGQTATATIRIPLAEGASSTPATIPLFYFDESLGRWIEEGEATLTVSGGVPVYEGTVSHFTTWNADRVFESVDIQGCVIDIDGNAVANTEISTLGSDYIGSARTVADSDGSFVIPARISSRVFLSAFSGTQSRTITVNTSTSNLVLEDCLVVDEAASTITLSWGEHPSDLDTHFFGPDTAEGDSLFHIYYSNKTEDVGGTTLHLDVDDTSSFGPEILSIPAFPFPGTYRYSVYKYSGSSDIQASPARIELNLNGELSIFSPPVGEATDCWEVFDLEVAEGGSVTIVPLNRWQASSSSCTSAPSDLLPAETASRRSSRLNPFQQHIESKHYAE